MYVIAPPAGAGCYVIGGRVLLCQYSFAFYVFKHGHLLDGDLVEFLCAYVPP